MQLLLGVKGGGGRGGHNSWLGQGQALRFAEELPGTLSMLRDIRLRGAEQLLAQHGMGAQRYVGRPGACRAC